MKSTILTEKKISARFKDGFDLIQVILGPRQVGKTTAIQNILKKLNTPYLYVSAEDSVAVDQNWLNEVWQQALAKDSKCLLVIDEVQKVSNWSERIKTLWDAQKLNKQQKLRLILLGSSSVKIQKGLTESLTGRFELIRAFHWTLTESNILAEEMNLEKYLHFGGYPKSYELLKNKDRFEKYIQNSIINTVIEKDLLSQAQVRNPALFRQTFQLLRTLPATEISYTKLLGQLQEKGNTDLIKNYLDLYEGAFLITQIHKYSHQTFKTKLSTPKIICMAPALLDQGSKKNPEFLGLCFESLVGSDLIRAGFNLFYWREGDYEIDFVFEHNSKLIGLEVKSQKRKSSKSVKQFANKFPKAHIVYINFESYVKFALDPVAYIEKMI